MAAAESHQNHINNHNRNKEHRIESIITSLHHQPRPVLQKLKESLIDEEQIQQILKRFWTPTERLQKSSERIHTSSSKTNPSIMPPTPSTAASSLPPPPEEDAIEKLSAEVGTDVRSLLRQVAVMFEILPEKVAELTSLEKELKEADMVIERYQQMMEKFTQELDEFSLLIPTGTLPPEQDFLETLNANITRHLVERNIPEKLERYQILLEQIAMIRSFVELIHQRVTMSSPGEEGGGGERLPVCKVCLDAKADYIMVPCGHLSCEVCMNRMNSVNSRCYFCRRNVADIIKVFY
jgi:hypothetical protein